MARIRTVKPELFRHEALFELERETGLPIRLAFIGLWTACDREGRFKWASRQLKLDCLPFDDIDFSRVLDALFTRGFLVKYEAPDGHIYGAIPSWKRHQFINNKEPASLFPSPEESKPCTCDSRVADACETRGVKEGKGREGERKGREGEGTEQLPRAAKSAPRSENTAAWDAYSASFQRRYGIAPERGRQANSLIKALVSDIGLENAIAVCSYFPSHPDALYVRSRHPLTLLKRDAQRVLVDMRSATPMTSTRANGIDATASNPFLPLLAEAREREARERGEAPPEPSKP